MGDKTRNRMPYRRAALAFVLALGAFFATAPTSFAEDAISDFFGGLFGGQQRAAPAPRPSAEPRVRRMMPHQDSRNPTYWRGARAPKKATEPASNAPPPAAATFFVAVMGDSLGSLLSTGLQENYATTPDIGVLKRARDSSGLVRDDFYDWPKAARDIANEARRIDVAVMLIGSNDRQAIRQGAESFEPFSPRWRELYAARVDAVLAPFREKKIPVVWVGLPIMKNESYSADIAKLNEIYREHAARDGDVFVDLWESSADERGQFNAFGPDVNGQIVKLRTADGVHFTAAGARSVALFVANEIKKFYDAHRSLTPEAQPSAAAPSDQSAQPGAATPPAAPGAPVIFRSPVAQPFPTAPVLPERPAIGPVQSLNAAPPVASNELARRGNAPATDPNAAAAQALTRHVFMEGGDQSPRPNRADDYTFKR